MHVWADRSITENEEEKKKEKKREVKEKTRRVGPFTILCLFLFFLFPLLLSCIHPSSGCLVVITLLYLSCNFNAAPGKATYSYCLATCNWNSRVKAKVIFLSLSLFYNSCLFHQILRDLSKSGQFAWKVNWEWNECMNVSYGKGKIHHNSLGGSRSNSLYWDELCLTAKQLHKLVSWRKAT